MVRPTLVLLGLGWATSASAQNNGLPSQQESAVLIELIAERGEDCDLLRPWQAASLRMQTRDLVARYDESVRARIREEIAVRRLGMTCEDPILTTWIGAAGPNFEPEYLPELLAGYRALALSKPPMAAFTAVTGRTDYADALARINAKLAELEAAGVRPPGGMSWQALADRQAVFAAQIAAAAANGGEPGRFSPQEAVRIAEDVARITELWLLDPP
jgi:hypothetical protein